MTRRDGQQMHVLVIEDDEFKARRISLVVRDIAKDCILQVEKSVNAGLSALMTKRPDLLLLDMSLTTFNVGPQESGGRPQNFGGIEVLEQMERLDVQVPVIIITQFESFRRGDREIGLADLRVELNERYAGFFKGLIFYNSAEGRWERDLSRIMARDKKGSRRGKDLGSR